MIIAVSSRVSLVGDTTVCTVPHTVVEDMRIGEGDRLLWTLRANGMLTVDVLRSECTCRHLHGTVDRGAGGTSF